MNRSTVRIRFAPHCIEYVGLNRSLALAARLRAWRKGLRVSLTREAVTGSGNTLWHYTVVSW